MIRTEAFVRYEIEFKGGECGSLSSESQSKPVMDLGSSKVRSGQGSSVHHLRLNDSSVGYSQSCSFHTL
jgi:hypothetical protein